MQKLKQLLRKKPNTKLLLAAFLLLAFVLRCYRIDNPVADWHAFRQADTASVTREYVKADKIDLLRPHYQDLSNIQSGKDNLEGYRMVEFPFINAALALVLRTFPQLDLVFVSRFASLLISLGSLLLIYALAKELSGKRVALYSAFAFAILPYAVYYSRVILPEPYVIFFSTLSIWQFLLWLKEPSWKHYLISLLAFIAAILLKPFVAFLGFVYLALLISFGKRQSWRDFRLYLYPVLAFIPLFAWRQWIQQFPTGIAASDWLFNGNGIRFRPAWFRWLFYERMVKLFSGFVGSIFLLWNFKKISKDFFIYAAWWLGIFAYFVVIATGNVQHDYYQNIVLPIFCISLGRGTEIFFLWLRGFFQKVTPLRKISGKLALFVIFLFTGIAWYFAWQQVKGYFNVNHYEYVHAGQAVDQLTPADSKVIAPAMGDTQFLFQTNRRGWPIGFEIDDKIAKGASIYVTTSFDDEAKTLEEKYSTIAKTAEYLILDLSREKSL
jgi:hypothetical protein